MTFAESKIVAQKVLVRLWHFLPKRALIAVSVLFALPIFGVLTAFGVATDTQLDKLERHELVALLSLPAFEQSALQNEQFRASERIQRSAMSSPTKSRPDGHTRWRSPPGGGHG